MKIEWMDREYTDASIYYKEVVSAMPREDDIILGAKDHLDALELLYEGGLYVVELDDSDIFVDGWRVNSPWLAHKHPEFGMIERHYSTRWEYMGMVECDVHHKTCGICKKQIPGEIEMMYQFYRLDG